MQLPFVSRDRYNDAKAEIARLTQRVSQLEERLDARAVGVLQTALRKHGYAPISASGELVEHKEPDLAPLWNPIDWKVYEAFERDYMTHTGATKEEASQEYKARFGNLQPSKALIV